MKIGVIASLIGIGMLAYNHYLCSIGETAYLIAYALIVVGVLFYFFVERE